MLRIKKTDYQIVVLKDVSNAFNSQVKSIQNEFQQLLTATLSHEQLTPLNSIVNLVEVLMKKKCDQFDKTTLDEDDIQLLEFLEEREYSKRQHGEKKLIREIKYKPLKIEIDHSHSRSMDSNETQSTYFYQIIWSSAKML